jgi:response regulator RpfG family c-di-GMP phosphodiesterase
MDAIEVCRRIKANAETRHITVLVASGHPTTALENKASAAGATRVIKKPLDVQLLFTDLGLPAPRKP